jgi:hypothetical protein
MFVVILISGDVFALLFTGDHRFVIAKTQLQAQKLIQGGDRNRQGMLACQSALQFLQGH